MTKKRNRDDAPDPMAALQPFLDADLPAWRGLPDLPLSAVRAAWGNPATDEEAALGWFPARRLEFPMDVPCGGIDAYVRDERVILIQSRIPPPASVLKALGEPTAIKPHEIIVEEAYVHEYLYCKRGLVLSVAQPFEKSQPLRIVRCRGIRRLEGPGQFNSKLYQSIGEKVVFRGRRSGIPERR